MICDVISQQALLSSIQYRRTCEFATMLFLRKRYLRNEVECVSSNCVAGGKQCNCDVEPGDERVYGAVKT